LLQGGVAVKGRQEGRDFAEDHAMIQEMLEDLPTTFCLRLA
jgi:hypothetical protein